MKQIFKKVSAVLLATFAVGILSANAQDLQTINPGSQTVTVTRSVAVPFQPTESGILTVSCATTSSISDMGGNAILFKDAGTTYENRLCDRKSLIWADDPGGPAQIWEAEVEAGTTYYIMYGYWMASSSMDFTFDLAAGVSMEDTNLIPWVPKVAKKGVAYKFVAPEGAAGVLKMKIVANTTTDLRTNGEPVVVEDPNNYPDPVTVISDFTVEGDRSSYLYSDYSNWGPWYFQQDVLDEVTITLEFPDYMPTDFEDIVLEPGVRTDIHKGQKGKIAVPEGADIRGRVDIKITAETTVDLKGDATSIVFEDDQWGGATNIAETTVEDGKTIYLFQPNTSYGPWYFQQSVLDVVTITLSFPQFDDLETIALDTPFDGKAGTTYKLTLDKTLTVSVTAPQAMNEKEWGRVIYKDATRANAVLPTNTDFGTEASPLSVETANFRLSAGTYYFYVTNAGQYSLTEYIPPVVKDPFNATPMLVAPIEGVEAAYLWTIKFPNQVLKDVISSTGEGVKITNPNGKVLGIRRAYVEPSSDTNSTIDAVSFAIAYDDYPYATVAGQYKVYIPEGFVTNTDDEPNPEVNLTYTMKPQAADDEPDYFTDSSYEFDVPSEDEILLNELQTLTITFPWPIYAMTDGQTDKSTVTVSVQVNGEDANAVISGNKLIVATLQEAGEQDMQVQVVIPAGRITNDQACTTPGKQDMVQVNGRIAIPVNLYGAKEEANWNIENGKTICSDEDHNIEVRWENGLAIYNNSDMTFEGSGITLQSTKRAVADNYLEEGTTVLFTDENDGLIFDMGGLDAGEYVLTIPKAAIKVVQIDGQAGGFGDGLTYTYKSLNKDTNLNFIISDLTTGVEVITPDENGIFTVYNLNGVKVAEGKANVLEGLQKGMYIINGKKYLVK